MKTTIRERSRTRLLRDVSTGTCFKYTNPRKALASKAYDAMHQVMTNSGGDRITVLNLETRRTFNLSYSILDEKVLTFKLVEMVFEPLD